MHQMPSLAEFLETPEGAELTAFFQERSLAAGALLDDGEEDRLLIVRSGRMRVYLTSQGRELSLSYLSPGDVFSTHTRAQLSAQQPSRVLLAPRRVVERRLASVPVLQAAVLRVLAATLAQSMTMIEDLAFHQVRGRLSRYLLRILERQQTPASAGARIDLGFAMEEIAALLGTTRQTASTELNAMVRDGAIARIGRGQIVLLQPDTLRAWAGPGEAPRRDF